MTRLSKQDNDTLRKQEWRMLFNTQQVAAIAGSSASASAAAYMGLPQEGLFSEQGQDTFLVKTFFSESEMYYLILLTNLKQCWYEKLEIEDIRERSQSIKSFAYEEDSQLEALLVSLSAIFTAQQDTGITPLDSSTKRHLEPHGEKLSLVVGFIYGIASVQWEFKLSPLLATSENVHTLLGGGPEHRYSSSMLKRKSRKTQDQATLPRRRNFLEDSDQEEEDNNDNDNDSCNGSGLQQNPAQVDGMAVLYDHLILPLISLTNAYRRQAKSLENVIKAKENEVFEALEMLEQSGAGYHSRRRATERYDKARTETKLQEELEKQVRPQMLGPRELFSDKKVSALCSIVAKNAMEKDPSLASQGEMVRSQDQSIGSQGSLPRTTTRTGVAEPSSIMTVPRPAGDIAASSGGESSGTKASKRSEELERRRLLQERLDREKIEKERAPKKKKLF